MRQRLGDRQLALVGQDRLGDQAIGELGDRGRPLANGPTELAWFATGLVLAAVVSR